MTVRAKFKVDRIEDESNGEGKRVWLSAVTTGSVENAEFFRYTPSATLQMAIVNAAASEQFKVGGEVYVDFTPVEPPAPAVEAAQ